MEFTTYPDFRESLFEFPTRIIGIDASDGSGKSTFCRYLVNAINQHFENKKAQVFYPFSLSDNLLAIFKRHKDNPYMRNLIYLESVRINYQDHIIPHYRNGGICIIDSSPYIRIPAYFLSIGQYQLLYKSLNYLSEENPTYSLLPGIRVILNASTQDCLKNILARKKISEGDPVNLLEIQKRRVAYSKSVGAYYRQFGSATHWVYFLNKRLNISGEQVLAEHFDPVIKRVINHIS